MTRTDPMIWSAAGNDYRGIGRLEPGPAPSLAVIITSGERDWNATLKALAEQAYDGVLEIVALTEQSLPSTAGSWPLTTLSPGDGEHSPIPGASMSGADVLLFLGLGEIPGPRWVERHMSWHRRAGNVVVIGSNDGAGARAKSARRGVRRSRRLLSGDEPFVAFSRSNVSMRRQLWARAFEDTSLDLVAGWTLWNDGAFFVYDPLAKVEPSNPAQSDEEPKTNDALVLEDRIPLRRFRPTPSAFHATPKVSWVIAVTDIEEVESAWQRCQQSTFSDHEIVFHGPSAAFATIQDLSTDNPRVSVVVGEKPETFMAAVAASRGELIAVFDPRARLGPETLAKAVARFEANRSTRVVRVGYRLDGDRYLRFDDLLAIDRGLGVNGLPLFAVVARRELMKDPAVIADPHAAWASVLARDSPALVISPLVELHASAPIRARPAGLAALSSAGVREIAQVIVREARQRKASARIAAEMVETSVDANPGKKVSVAYVGFTGHNNLGDEAVMTAIQRLMPWARIEADAIDPQLLMVGGGTLINGRRYYLNRLLRQESATVERALFGTGVRSPDYWGATEPMEDWFSFIDSALVAAVRGPDSVKNLRKLGFGRDLPVIGDPALSLRPPESSVRVAGRIVVCPVYTDGNLHGGSDEAVFAALAVLIGKFRAEGREVVMMSAFPQDDRWVIELMRRAGADDSPYVPGYADIDKTMGLLASADLVIGERLHASIMAAAAGTPFVGLEYRPKVRDFARSVAQEDAVIRTDEMHRLDEVCARVLRESKAVVEVIASYVSDYRRRQEDAATELLRRFENG